MRVGQTRLGPASLLALLVQQHHPMHVRWCFCSHGQVWWHGLQQRLNGNRMKAAVACQPSSAAARQPSVHGLHANFPCFVREGLFEWVADVAGQDCHGWLRVVVMKLMVGGGETKIDGWIWLCWMHVWSFGWWLFEKHRWEEKLDRNGQWPKSFQFLPWWVLVPFVSIFASTKTSMVKDNGWRIVTQ